MKISFAILSAAVVFACAALVHCARAVPTSCDVAEDCNGSEESRVAGRCGPEVACVDGACRAECLGRCEVTETRFPLPQCENGGVCSAPARNGIPTTGSCTKRPIRCENAADCPLLKPDAGEWTCENGTCAFPGFAYEYP